MLSRLPPVNAAHLELKHPSVPISLVPWATHQTSKPHSIGRRRQATRQAHIPQTLCPLPCVVVIWLETKWVRNTISAEDK